MHDDNICSIYCAVLSTKVELKSVSKILIRHVTHHINIVTTYAEIHVQRVFSPAEYSYSTDFNWPLLCMVSFIFLFKNRCIFSLWVFGSYFCGKHV